MGEIWELSFELYCFLVLFSVVGMVLVVHVDNTRHQRSEANRGNDMLYVKFFSSRIRNLETTGSNRDAIARSEREHKIQALTNFL
jgi:hypothetical protein